MYLAHFGLTEPPFRITPVTVFFFSGANRGEILDALIYSISEVEGIVKVSGEVGSGKTMLCRMLLEKLPAHIEAIYLANPSLSREEMLYAIADGLGLSTAGERVGVIMSMIQNKLEEKAREGKRIVVLVDEAHAMPLDTLEELRLLYNLQVGNAKLLQIVLFGQPELNTKLDQPNMRQLKDRIVHHFHMQPLSRNILESYLMFRMRAAGYHGPNVFSLPALKLIANASNGLMRRVNILADKSLLAAFIDDTYYVKPQHVQAALRDNELSPVHYLTGKRLLIAGTATAMVVLATVAWWMLMQRADISPPPVADNLVLSLSNREAYELKRHELSNNEPLPAPSQPIQNSAEPSASNTPVATPAAAQAPGDPTTQFRLFEQRLAAGKQLLEQTTSTNSGQEKTVASIQLYYNEDVNPERIEGFLRRADILGVLSEIYILPEKFGSRNGMRALYGAYPSIEAAQNAVKDMPKRYQDAFATSTYIF